MKLEKKAEMELFQLIEKEILTKEDIKVLLRWVSDMEEFGPDYIAESHEWYDHPLKREWLGYRASAFSHKGRVIYRILSNVVVIQVVRVTTEHNYKR